MWLCFEGNPVVIPERLGSVLLRECDLTLLVRLWWHVPSGKIKVAVLENHLPTAVHWNLDAEFLCRGRCRRTGATRCRRGICAAGPAQLRAEHAVGV